MSNEEKKPFDIKRILMAIYYAVITAFLSPFENYLAYNHWLKICDKYDAINPHWYSPNSELAHAATLELRQAEIGYWFISILIWSILAIIGIIIFDQKDNIKKSISMVGKIGIISSVSLLVILLYYKTGFNGLYIVIPGLMIYAVIYESVKIKKEEKMQKTESDSATIPES